MHYGHTLIEYLEEFSMCTDLIKKSRLVKGAKYHLILHDFKVMTAEHKLNNLINSCVKGKMQAQKLTRLTPLHYQSINMK